jgi:hypothetical protein
MKNKIKYLMIIKKKIVQSLCILSSKSLPPRSVASPITEPFFGAVTEHHRSWIMDSTIPVSRAIYSIFLLYLQICCCATLKSNYILN